CCRRRRSRCRCWCSCRCPGWSWSWAWCWGRSCRDDSNRAAVGILPPGWLARHAQANLVGSDEVGTSVTRLDGGAVAENTVLIEVPGIFETIARYRRVRPRTVELYGLARRALVGATRIRDRRRRWCGSGRCGWRR